MKPILRHKSLISNNTSLETLCVLDGSPVFMGCTTAPPESDLRHSLIWQIDDQTGLIQLRELIPLDVLYPAAHNAGLIGSIWDNHHFEFAKFINKFSPQSVLEIGGSHGVLCHKYNKYAQTPWVIVDLNPIPALNSPAKFIDQIFDENFEYNDYFDTLVHSHFFEHIYDPEMIIEKMASLLEDDKKMIFSIPNMEVMLRNKYSNCLNFEHTYFITEPYIELLLSKNKFKVLEKQYFLSDHSIFYCVMKDESIDVKELPSGLYEKNKSSFMDYIAYYEKLVNELNEIISSNEKTVYLFGAHIFSQNLILFGLKADKIRFVLDNDTSKQGKRLYGTDLFVAGPQILKNDLAPVVILKAGVYNDEIKRQVLGEINPSVVFYE